MKRRKRGKVMNRELKEQTEWRGEKKKSPFAKNALKGKGHLQEQASVSIHQKASDPNCSGCVLTAAESHNL